MSLRKQLIVGLVATALVPGLSLGMSGLAAARGGGLGGGGHFSGAHFSGGHFAGAHFGGVHNLGGPGGFMGSHGFNHFSGFTGHRFAHFRHFGHRRRVAFFGVGLGLGYGAADSCWQWVPTRLGWRWAWVCDPYY